MNDARRAKNASVMMLIEEQEQRLLGMHRRLCGLQALENELVRRLGEHPFIIRNDLLWISLLDTRDALVILMASWVRGMTEGGGFFARLKGTGSNALFVARPKKDDEDETAERRERFESRFPASAAAGSVRHEHVDELKDSLYKALKHVVEDRDSFRAHPYEAGGKATARMLAIHEIHAALVYAEDLINDLRLFADGSTMNYHNSIGAMPDSNAAEDMVDLLMFGTVDNLIADTGAGGHLHGCSGAYWWQHRSAFLSQLQRLHTARVEGESDLPVNADALVAAATRAITATRLAQDVTVRDPYGDTTKLG
ncbi:MAG: hypothetical protein K8W52_10225 [Deltaproteobacteria bacterium]|nr:hypothetical protein [Deltaproteobacteria bacterium]